MDCDEVPFSIAGKVGLSSPPAQDSGPCGPSPPRGPLPFPLFLFPHTHTPSTTGQSSWLDFLNPAVRQWYATLFLYNRYKVSPAAPEPRAKGPCVPNQFQFSFQNSLHHHIFLTCYQKHDLYHSPCFQIILTIQSLFVARGHLPLFSYCRFPPQPYIMLHVEAEWSFLIEMWPFYSFPALLHLCFDLLYADFLSHSHTNRYE